MKCPYCKEENPPGVLKCTFCGEPLSGGRTVDPRTEYIPDYLVQAILVTICCCLPFGIPAIVFAARVKAFSLSGQYAMAREASEKAKMWCWVGFLIGLVIGAIYMLAAMTGNFLEEF
jgi:hypothetical protein